MVQLGERKMSVREVLNLVPGAIIELNRSAESELDLLVNNVKIGCGNAVKVGENFGVQVTYVGDVRQRISAMSGQSANDALGGSGDGEAGEDLAALAEAMLSGQT